MANEFFTDEHTQILQKLVREVVNDPKTYIGSRFFPSVAVNAAEIYTEVVEATGGLTNPHVIGTDPTVIQSFGTRVQKFEPPAYKEKIIYNEKQILRLRQLGEQDRSRAGIRQRIDLDIDRLNRRLEARFEYERWQVIINGSFTWMGQTFSYGVPAANRAVPLGALWSLDGKTANNLADPLTDIRYWCLGGYAPYRKYFIRKMYMNPNTARFILDNSNVKSYIQNGVANPNITAYDVNNVLKFFIPACPEVEIYNGWYQAETTVNGKLTVGDAIYMLPDGYIFFDVSLADNQTLGEFVQAQHLAGGTVDQPGFGKFLVVEENIAPGTKGGPSNPYIEVLSGCYGGIKLDQPFNMLTAKVI